ncbi:hypothetical protein [Flammeovirga sp. SJP92]|uniref:DUF7003 family protein n=1 Tax=Flammeovirga sp. SJP92 TaxID=1775430 RepID=UPI000786CD42|nr:hypothetical protein [Flammeovirga sp. SJP92]KXX66488.1 hypothetical protein AVL50_31675 [Flammeovirga sp. SJP92]
MEEINFTEKEILQELDLAFHQVSMYNHGRIGDIKYNFFLDLEHGYCVSAGSRIHLYADSARWALVFERNGYHNRGFYTNIELNYFGNCIDYPKADGSNSNDITNTSDIILIETSEFQRIENKEGEEMENFELIGKDIQEIKIRDQFVPFNNNHEDYEKVGIEIRKEDNPDHLIGFGDLIRYLHETNSSIIKATENDILKHIPNDIPKLMTIEEFHFESVYEETPPSQQETYKLLAKILITKDTSNWAPIEEPNNSWKNWESGNL